MTSKKVYIIIGLLVVLAAVALWSQSKMKSGAVETEVEIMEETN